mmetsp:Transcript_9270/g.23485  ORF Transcript_9270/g.23485 Transcript_9270/m.23485 type:complete len:215 (-) Transcript_9270:128-772(-)
MPAKCKLRAWFGRRVARSVPQRGVGPVWRRVNREIIGKARDVRLVHPELRILVDRELNGRHAVVWSGLEHVLGIDRGVVCLGARIPDHGSCSDCTAAVGALVYEEGEVRWRARHWEHGREQVARVVLQGARRGCAPEIGIVDQHHSATIIRPDKDAIDVVVLCADHVDSRLVHLAHKFKLREVRIAQRQRAAQRRRTSRRRRRLHRQRYEARAR